MKGIPVTKKEIQKIIQLRQTGHSLPEIRRLIKRGNSTVFKYIQGVTVLPYFVDILREKQGGSKERAQKAWKNAQVQVTDLLGAILTKEQRLCIMASLYWGEGNKSQLDVINSDPALIKVFMTCLGDIGVKNENIKIGLRLHQNIDRYSAIKFWSQYLSVDPDTITGIEIIQKSGKKKGKLKFGMCRLRVAKSAPYFKLLMSLIHEIKHRFNAAVVQRIEQGTPKP